MKNSFNETIGRMMESVNADEIIVDDSSNLVGDISNALSNNNDMLLADAIGLVLNRGGVPRKMTPELLMEIYDEFKNANGDFVTTCLDLLEYPELKVSMINSILDPEFTNHVYTDSMSDEFLDAFDTVVDAAKKLDK